MIDSISGRRRRPRSASLDGRHPRIGRLMPVQPLGVRKSDRNVKFLPNP